MPTGNFLPEKRFLIFVSKFMFGLEGSGDGNWFDYSGEGLSIFYDDTVGESSLYGDTGGGITLIKGGVTSLVFSKKFLR